LDVPNAREKCKVDSIRLQSQWKSEWTAWQVFLEGVKAALTADSKFQGGWYSPEDPPVTGLRAAARVYAGWGFTQAFYWHEVSLFLA
jgi:homoserine acetyltransferase